MGHLPDWEARGKPSAGLVQWHCDIIYPHVNSVYRVTPKGFASVCTCTCQTIAGSSLQPARLQARKVNWKEKCSETSLHRAQSSHTQWLDATSLNPAPWKVWNKTSWMWESLKHSLGYGHFKPLCSCCVECGLKGKGFCYVSRQCQKYICVCSVVGDSLALGILKREVKNNGVCIFPWNQEVYIAGIKTSISLLPSLNQP